MGLDQDLRPEQPAGTLTLVGVGPGDPELLTVAAVRAIEAAAVVAYPVARLEAGQTATVRMAPETARLGVLPDRPFLSRYRDKFGH